MRTGPVDIDIEGRIVGRLLNARVRNAGYVTNPAQQFVCVGEIRIDVGAADLEVDRRRRTKIQDLADNVGRQEGEADAREQPRQLLAQHAHVLLGRLMALFQLDLDVAVLRTDHAGVVVGHVDAADRHADVVGERVDFPGRDDLADRLLHVGELVGAFLDTGTHLGTDMHQDRSGIDGGKEIPPEIRHQQE